MVALFSRFASAAAVLCASTSAVGLHEDPSSLASEFVFKAVSTKVGDLEARLAQMEADNQNELAAHKAKYQATLRAKQQANMELALQNSEISKRAEEWQGRNAELRNQAQELQRDTRLWQDDLNAVSLNITTALEITAATLTTFNDSKAPQLQILRDLDKQDLKRRAVHDHETRLNEIMSGSVGAHGAHQAAFMQTGKAKLATSSKQNPQTLIKALEDGLAELAIDHKKKEEALMTHYFELFQFEDKRHEGLLGEGKSLNATIVSLEGLHTRLVMATKHLKEINSELAERGQSIRAYAQRLGSRDLPSASSPLKAMKPAAFTATAPAVATVQARELSPEERFQQELDSSDDPAPKVLEQQPNSRTQQQEKPADAASTTDSSQLPSWLAWMKR